jgi:hypothetical protein
MIYPLISWEKEGCGEGGGFGLYSSSGHILEDDVNGFSSTSDICFMPEGYIFYNITSAVTKQWTSFIGNEISNRYKEMRRKILESCTVVVGTGGHKEMSSILADQ